MIRVCAWVWDHLLEYGQPPRGHIPKENWLFFCSSHQLPIAPHICMESHKSFLQPCWDFIWVDLVHILCVQSQLLWAHVCTDPVILSKYSFSADVPSLWLLQSLYDLLSRDDPWALGKGVVKQMSQLERRTPQSLILCKLISCGFLY